MSIRDYDQWKTASPWDEQTECIDITKELKALGKVGHGLCGKDADLDYGGQIRVVGAFILETSLVCLLDIYKTQCEPCQDDDESDRDYENRKEAYGDLVCCWNDYSGEWTGDDWIFWLKNTEHHYQITMPFDWSDDIPDKKLIDRAVTQLFNAIFDDVNICRFQNNMTALSKAGERQP